MLLSRMWSHRNEAGLISGEGVATYRSEGSGVLDTNQVAEIGMPLVLRPKTLPMEMFQPHNWCTTKSGARLFGVGYCVLFALPVGAKTKVPSQCKSCNITQLRCVENAHPNLFPCGSGNPKQPSLICLQSAAHWAHLPSHRQRCWASERGNTKNRSLPSPSWGPKCIPVTCWGGLVPPGDGKCITTKNTFILIRVCRFVFQSGHETQHSTAFGSGHWLQHHGQYKGCNSRELQIYHA